MSARPVPDRLWLLICLALSSLWCLTAGAKLGATFDEPLYLERGLEAWRTGSHAGLLRLGTMPLPADLQTLPLYGLELWRGTPVDPRSEIAALLPIARATTLAFWVVLLVYGWLAGRQIGGRLGGTLAVGLLASEPSLLAHAALATTDIALAACLLAFAYHVRAGREASTWRRIVVPGLWFGIALLAKASALAMGTLCLLALQAQRHWSDRRFAWKQARRDILAVLGLGLALAFVFCGSDWLPETSFVAWARSLPDGATGKSAVVWLAEHLRIFNNAGEALVRQLRHNWRGHGSFLLGHAHPRAVWYYFPALLTMKLSEPLLLAVPLIGVFRHRALANWALLLAAVLLVASLTFRVQIGIRMVLPIVVFAAIGVGGALANATGAGGRAAVAALAGCAVAALAWNLNVAASLWPDALVHVNRFWGGPANAYRLVSDSNHDWGQGIPALLDWNRAHGGAELAVWYFGTDPRAAAAPLRLLPLHQMSIREPHDVVAAAGGGRLAVGTTLLWGSDPSRGTAAGESFRNAAAALRTLQPIGRTPTFLVFDLGTPP